MNKKFQQLGPVRNEFVQSSWPRPPPRSELQALDARIRVILGVPPRPAASASARSAARRSGRPSEQWLARCPHGIDRAGREQEIVVLRDQIDAVDRELLAL